MVAAQAAAVETRERDEDEKKEGQPQTAKNG